MENINEQIKIEKRSRGRPKQEHTVNDDGNYYKNYYHSSGNGDRVICERCNRESSKLKLKRHQTTPLCVKFCEIKLKKESEELKNL